jgi:hypothetical protein
MTPEWFNYYATNLVLAERLCVGRHVFFHRVVAFEVRAGVEYNEETITHTMTTRDEWYEFTYGERNGFRDYSTYDRHVGVTVCHNRKKGRVTKRLMQGAIDQTDIEIARHNSTPRAVVNLNMSGQFAAKSFFYYRFVLEHMVGIESNVDVDRFGKMTELEPYVGRLLIGAAQSDNRQRRAEQRASAEEVWMGHTLYRASRWSDESLRCYRAEMEKFNHRWGDGHQPRLTEAMSSAILAAAM